MVMLAGSIGWFRLLVYWEGGSVHLVDEGHIMESHGLVYEHSQGASVMGWWGRARVPL